MNKEDTAILDMLRQDKGKRYKVVVDNDSVIVEDKAYEYNEEKDEGSIVHMFHNYGWEFIVELLNYFKIEAEEV